MNTLEIVPLTHLPKLDYGGQAVGFVGKDHSTCALVKYRDPINSSHAWWFLIAQDPISGHWYRVDDRQDLRPSYIPQSVPPYWSKSISPMPLSMWLERLEMCFECAPPGVPR